MNIIELARIKNTRTLRESSWDRTGRNADFWQIKPGETKVLADIKGPGCITHLWMAQASGYRECLLKFYWDGASQPSVNVPLGDFFCLGHGMVNSFGSLLFSASSHKRVENKISGGCALNCYVPMPFRKSARVELVNQGKTTHTQYFYIDYEKSPSPPDKGLGLFHAEFRRENPFGGWAHEIHVNTPEANVVNKARQAWDNNYVILNAKGRGHYVGCNLSVTNFQGTWWGEGDDMIWVDGYKWPPDLHGTGSEDYLSQAWGMQANAYLRNGSSLFERNTGGYQTSYVFHIENPVRFQKEIKVTIEHGHGNHLANEMSSTAYWYADKPATVATPPAVAKRMPVLRDSAGNWLHDKKSQSTSRKVKINQEMRGMKTLWKNRNKGRP